MVSFHFQNTQRVSQIKSQMPLKLRLDLIFLSQVWKFSLIILIGVWSQRTRSISSPVSSISVTSATLTRPSRFLTPWPSLQSRFFWMSPSHNTSNWNKVSSSFPNKRFFTSSLHLQSNQSFSWRRSSCRPVPKTRSSFPSISDASPLSTLTSCCRSCSS